MGSQVRIVGFQLLVPLPHPPVLASPMETLVMTVRRRAILVSRVVREAEREALDMTSHLTVSFFWTAAFSRLSSATTIVFPVSISCAWFSMPL